ncbi:uncharacterized protein V1510DRAFT_412426 [Dipodascopsis tothii]|uniref:uncharacterized protein n=1 Tax=Dipodascopsis tothii TaxID=44089 RepID=UPI0034CFBC3B
MDIRNELAQMGFPVSRIEAAIRNATAPTVEDAVAWLEAHPLVERTDDDDDAGDADREDGEIEKGSMSAAAGSLVCGDCGKRFKTGAFAELHATKTGHVNFEESTDKIPELTADEKKAKLDELRQKAAVRKAEAAKRDAELDRANEVLRRKADKESAAMIEERKRKELVKEAEARRREQREEVLAKQRVKAQIEADRRARQERAERERAARAGTAAPAAAAAAPAAAAAAAPGRKREYTESRLQIRAVVQTFPLDTTLFEVAHAVQDRTGVAPTAAVFVTTFPTKRYGADDLGLSLREANLVNTAVMLKRA